MTVRRFIVIVFIVISLTTNAIAQESMQMVTGYGANKELALQDAFATVVQLTISELIYADVYVQNSQMIDANVIAHSESFIDVYDTIVPFDGISITIVASVKSQYLRDELNLYSRSQINEQTGASVDIDMVSIFAKYDSRQRQIDDRKRTVLVEGAAIFNELMSARRVVLKSHSNPMPIEDSSEYFRFILRLEQEVNEIRYASAINKLEQLFINIGAQVSYISLIFDTIPANTIVLENIDGIAIAYTFDEETFACFKELFYDLKALNWLQSIKINFLDTNAVDDSKVLAYAEHFTVDSYFTNISSSTMFGSFIIYPRLSPKNLQASVIVNRRHVERANRIVSEYNHYRHESALQALLAEEEALEWKHRYDRNKEKYGYFNSLGLKAGRMSVDKALMHDDNSLDAFGMEINKFLVSFPYVGAGIDFTYASGTCSENTSACNATEIDLMDIGLHAIARYPFVLDKYIVELHAAAAITYTMLDVSNTWLRYEDQFFGFSLEAGVTIGYLGLRYKRYMPKLQEFTFNYEKVDMTRDNVELILQYDW